jgi:exodeoxyribonuclease (lambda-induced)
MIHLPVEQGGAEWARARMAIPTASQFDKIITAGGKLSGQAEKYASELLAEELLQIPLDNASSGYMNRGSVMEERAVRFYELQRDVDTEECGFILRDDRRVGASPDRLVGDDGLLEIKCPSAHVHVQYLLDSQGIGYRVQVQGQLWIAEREWSDTLSYHPDLPPALVRQARDEEFIAKIAAAVGQFLSYLDECKVKLNQHGLFEDFRPEPLRVVA